MTQRPAILMLADGTVFHGKAVGKIGTTTGEICFNTGMTGYQEIFTDPSYFGQLLVATSVHIGNYGTIPEEAESRDIKISGLICKDFSIPYSRKLSEHSIQDYFEAEGLVGISDVDTRAIVRHIRSKGAMNAIISSEILDEKYLTQDLAKVPSMHGLELASKVSTPEAFTVGNPWANFKVAVMDYGVKQSILDQFSAQDFFVKVFPAQTPFEEVQAWSPDGFFLSNGPGDPAAMDYAIDFAKKAVAEDKPVFGICLGHQLLALALDIPTYKMHHGHRGINHPVKNLMTGKSEITSQNHGFGVSPEALEANKEKINITHVNLNDQTIEGIEVIGKPCFSVQYHPEASPGPHDARYLFDRFKQVITDSKNSKRSGKMPMEN